NSTQGRTTMTRLHSALLAATVVVGSLVGASFAQAQDIPAAPAPGVSARVDAIRASGVLRVGVQNNDPWLVQNTTGQGEPWSGPAELLAQTLADQMGVKLEYVPTSNETKITLLAANQADMSISALGVNPDREKVVDFIVYSTNSTCMVYRKDNPKFANVETVD